MRTIVSLRSRFGAALVQTALGYLSASLGLVNELLVAARFGANERTDAFRWAGLFPFYAILVGSLAAPLLFRSRLYQEQGSLHLLIEREAGVRPTAWYRTAGLISLLASFSVAAISVSEPSRSTMVLAASCLAFAQLIFCIGMVPTFLSGTTWIFVSLSAGYNACVLVGLLLSPKLEEAITWSMVAAAIVTCATVLLAPLLDPAYRSPRAFREIGTSGRDGLSVLLPPTISNIASALSVLCYFRSLSLAGAGVLSIYSVAQKSGLLLAVPGNAILNRHFREDSLHGNMRTGGVLRSVLPFALASPLVAFFSFALLCAVYNLEPDSPTAAMVAVGCSFCTAFAALTLATNILAIGRVTGRHTIAPSIISVAISGLAAVAIYLCRGQTWITGIPAFASAVAAVAALAWVSRNSGGRQRSTFVVFGLCLVAAAMTSVILITAPEISGAPLLRDVVRQVVGWSGMRHGV